MNARRAVGATMIVGTAAMLAYVWVLWLPFALDDYSHIAATGGGAAGEEAVVSGAETATRLADPEAQSGEEYMFRPVFRAWLRTVRWIQGVPVEAWGFHLAALLLHGATALLAFRLFLRFSSAAGALCGALFLAIHPAGAQAVSWIAAGSDVLLTFATLVGLWSALRFGGATGAILAGVATAAAVACKVTGLVSVPLVGCVVAVVAWRQDRGRAWRRVLLFALPVIGVILWRQIALGTWSLTYAGGTRAGLSALPALLERVPDYLTTALAPVNEFPDVIDTRPVAVRALTALLPEDASLTPRAGLAGLVALPLVAGLLLAPVRVLPRLLLALLAYALLALPGLFLFVPPEAGQPHSNTLSRIFYSAQPALAAAFAVCLGADSGPGRWRRRVPIALWVITLGLGIDLMVHVARTEVQAGARIEQRLEAVEAALSDEGAPVVVVLDPESSWAGIPQLEALVQLAFLPPFRSEPGAVIHAASEMTLVDSGLLARIPGAVRILGLEAGRLVAKGPRLAPRPTALPELVAEAGAAARWTPRSEVPPRAFTGLRFVLPPGEALALGLRLEAGEFELTRVLKIAAGAGPRAFDVLVGNEAEWMRWLLSPRLTAVALRAETGVLPEGIAAPRLLGEGRALALRAPAEGARLSLGEAPRCVVADRSEARRLRFRFDILQDALRVPMVFLVAPARLERVGDDAVAWTWSPADPGSGPYPAITWGSLPSLWRQHLEPRGVRALSVRWRAELLHADGATVAARSPWRSLVVEGP